MKYLPQKISLMFLLGLALLYSCEKERSCESCQIIPTNKPPKVDAGSDQTVILPANSVQLDGSASIDPDGNITAWAWTNLSGPSSSFLFENSKANKTQVNYLTEGTYLFELKVTDNGNLSARDTVKIDVLPQPKGTEPDLQGVKVFIAGQDNEENAAVWKNGVIQSLPDHGQVSWALSVYASGPDLYVAGIEPNASMLGANGLYWKNGNVQIFGEWGTSVFVSDNDVYWAGGSLFKNGILQNIGSFWPFYVFVSGKDLYLAGYTDSGAGLWKNGEVQNLGKWDPSSLFVSGTDVYITGVVNNSDAVLWKNGVIQNLGPGATASVFVSGSDVYVAGTNKGDAILWKNGQATRLWTGGASGVFVSGKDVYVVGANYDGAVLWKNGVEYNLSGLKTANSIFVQ